MTRFAMQSFTWNVKLFPGLAAGNVGTAVQDGVEGRSRRHDCFHMSLVFFSLYVVDVADSVC